MRDSQTSIIDAHGLAVKSQPPSLAQTFQRLQGFEVKPDSQGPLDQIIPILSTYKAQLRELAVQSLKDAQDADALKTSVDAALRKAGIREAKDEERRPYGLVRMEIAQPQQQPDLLTVLFHLNLAHAVDTSLSIFRQRGGAWDLVYQLDRNDYFKWEGDAYGIASPQFTTTDANGTFLMLLASDSGRSGDGSYGLRVDLYRADSKFRMDQLFHKEFGVKADQIALDADGFRLETISMEHDIARAGYRVFPYRYQVQGDSVVRVAPIGFDAHDFIGEWGNLSWEEAAKWSNSANLAKIHEYYDKVREKDGYFIGEFGTPQVCDAQGVLWQIEFNEAGSDNSIYFLIQHKDTWTFVVSDVGTSMRRGCVYVEWNPRQPFNTMFSKPLAW